MVVVAVVEALAAIELTEGRESDSGTEVGGSGEDMEFSVFETVEVSFWSSVSGENVKKIYKYLTCYHRRIAIGHAPMTVTITNCIQLRIIY